VTPDQVRCDAGSSPAQAVVQYIVIADLIRNLKKKQKWLTCEKQKAKK
jgi:hypothetical protein